jgi:hypothetical protein
LKAGYPAVLKFDPLLGYKLVWKGLPILFKPLAEPGGVSPLVNGFPAVYIAFV